jgi:stage V sporulation protein AD
MTVRRTGHQTFIFDQHPIVRSVATVVGPMEGAGPLARDFDIVHADMMLTEKSWEKAERKMLEEACTLAIENAELQKESVDFFIAGDLMNQLTSASFVAEKLAIPHIGVFGACSTSMASLALGALYIGSGVAQHVLTATCSHNATAEKQFRYPTEYGAQKPPTAQHTVTGAGAAVLSNIGDGEGDAITIAAATIGRVIDMGITDPMNMGAAMAPAAVDTITAHLRDMRCNADAYDIIVTGDLAAVGHELACTLLHRHGIHDAAARLVDCGLLIFDRTAQEVQAGGSGCGCSAVVTFGHLFKRMLRGEWQRMLVVATGALLSPLTFQQGETIPSVAHAVAFCRTPRVQQGGET